MIEVINYDGVSCVTTGQEARMLLRYYGNLHEKLRLAPRKIMIGVATSSKSMLGLPVKRLNRFVKLSELRDVFTAHPLVLNIIHHATDDISTLALQLMQVAAHAGPNLHGFQLNTVLPSLDQLKALRKAFPRLRVIMNLSVEMHRMGHEMGGDDAAIEIARLVSRYNGGLITDVLVDASGGKGVPLSAETAVTYISAFRKTCSNLGIGLAGGLGPDLLHPLGDLIASDKQLSIDAESNLRNEDDDLDWDKVRKYLTQLGAMFAHGLGEDDRECAGR